MRSEGLPEIPAAAKLADRVWFAAHSGRKLRIRPPIGDEYREIFRTFGMHEEGRRRVIVCRLPGWQMRRHNVDFARVAMLLYADETVEDTDEVLAPILDELMREAVAGYEIPPRWPANVDWGAMT